MPLSITDLGRKHRSTSLVYEVEPGRSETVRLDYSPARYTATLEAQMRESAGDTTRQAEMVARLLATLLVGWDVLDGDGQPYPLTFEALLPLSTAFLSEVMQAIQADMLPGKPTAGTSDAGSSTAAPPA